LNNCQLHAILLHIIIFQLIEYHNHVEIVNFTGNSGFSFSFESHPDSQSHLSSGSGSIPIHSHASSTSDCVIVESNFVASNRLIVDAMSLHVESCFKTISFVTSSGPSVLNSCADASVPVAKAHIIASPVSNFFIWYFGNS
jgi:hypothetical protein